MSAPCRIAALPITRGRGVPSSFYSCLDLIAAQYSQFVHQDLAESSFEF